MKINKNSWHCKLYEQNYVLYQNTNFRPLYGTKQFRFVPKKTYTDKDFEGRQENLFIAYLKAKKQKNLSTH